MGTLVCKLDQYRKKRGMSQEKLAELTDCRRETIVRLEKGLYNPSLRLAYDIAQVFGVPIEEIFSYEETEEQEK